MKCLSVCVAVAGVGWAAAVAGACPVCSSETGEAVRAGIVGDVVGGEGSGRRGEVIVAVAGPFVVMGMVVGGVLWWPVRGGVARRR